MPTFPTYRGELPTCLSPLNPRHYLLLAYWAYFRPTALKCYLYQADSELYRAEGRSSIFRTWRVPAYRNLYLMVPGTVFLLSVLVGLPIVIIASWIQGVPVAWYEWLRGMAAGVALSVVLGMAGGVAFGVAFGVAGGVAFGIVLGMVASILEAILISNSVILDGDINSKFFIFASLSMAKSILQGVWLSISEGMALGIALGLVLRVMDRVAFSVAGGVALGLAGSVLFGLVGSVLFGVAGGVAFGIAGGIAGSLGLLRIFPFYPFELLLAWSNVSQKVRHPLEWDELLVLPLPRSVSMLIRRLEQNERDGLHLAAKVSRNPFQRWVAQRTLQRYFHNKVVPLHLLYMMLASVTFNEYVLAPIEKQDWERFPATKQLFLGELAGRWVDCGGSRINGIAQRLVWWLTLPLRDRRQTPLTDFAGMLYELLDSETIEADKFNLSSYRETYTNLTDYPGGEEIALSFEAMASFLSYDTLTDLPSALPIAAKLASIGRTTAHTHAPIRPTVLIALARLGEVAAEVAAFRDATSRVSQQAALLRATDGLDALDEYVVAKVMAPEQAILRRIVRQWRPLVSEAGGELGRMQLVGPVANPYVAGNPVTGALFVGREDILRQLEELWAPVGTVPSVVLYGHRRMGKTSILHNLGARFGASTTVVNFSMQLVGYVSHTNELLFNLALALYDSLTPSMQEKVGEPEEERYFKHNPYTALRRFVTQVGQIRSTERYLIMIDEFELLEEAIDDGRLDAYLLDFWRALIQTYAWFVMIFAGLHTLQEMTEDYWNPLFSSVTTIPVRFLRPGAARQLIIQPNPDFPLDYDADAIQEIIRLTNGQPYLIQLICRDLVTRFNRQTFEEGVERERRFTIRDVDAIINAPDFYRHGNAYFTGVWAQAATSTIAGQTTILRVLASSESALSLDGIAETSHLTPQVIEDALERLKQHDMVREEAGHWGFAVELMRRWVLKR